MFDKYIICTDGFDNVVENGQVSGFQLQVRLPYYRGLIVSMVEDFALKVDGESFPREALRVTLRGRTWTLDELAQETTERWEFGEKGTLTVRKPGGLAATEHTVELTVRLRISYFPFPLTGSDTKVLRLAAQAAAQQ